MSQRIIYISGPITGHENGNRHAFAHAADLLRSQGHRVINPHDLTEGLDLHPIDDYEKIMRIDVAHLVQRAEEVVTLDGWENSNGAKREVEIARLMNIPIIPLVKYASLNKPQ